MKLGPYELDQIYTGDAHQLAPAIPDESVDLIFTDPVYQNIDDYRWLAETAARVLKPDSACLVWCGIGYLPETLRALQVDGLRYRWQLIAGRPIGFPSQYCQQNTFSNYQSLLWLEKGKGFPLAAISDLVFSNDSSGMMYHPEWGKNINPFRHYLSRFVLDGAIILDPFCGGGTVPAVCKMLGRHWLAFEIDPQVAERARLRVLETQPPLFIPEPEQLALV